MRELSKTSNAIAIVNHKPSDYGFFYKALSSLNYVGDKRKPHYKRLCGERFIDLLWHLPSNLTKREYIEKVSDFKEGVLNTLEVTVHLHYPSLRRGKPYKILAHDANENAIELVFFNPYAGYLSRNAPEGRKILISGSIKRNNSSGLAKYQMTHPDFMGPIAEKDNWVGIERIYPLTSGLIRSMVSYAIDDLISKNQSNNDEWLDEKWNLPSFSEALKNAHKPKTLEDLTVKNINKQRLIMDEYVAYHLSMALSLISDKEFSKKISNNSYAMSKTLIESLPFELTNGQKQVIAEVKEDISKNKQMVRLIQGDVGSGKTLIALATALDVMEEGYQVAFLVPTEILARQHFASVSNYLKDLDVNADILTGREKGKKKQDILTRLESGEINLIVGTHSLIENSVIFKNLGLVIIDEQHRFGVDQRLKLSKKADNPHILSMTATPIPRTLLLANHGDMAVSNLKEKPVGRKEIITKVMNIEKINDIVMQLSKIIEQGRQIYWVCPMIEESETKDIAAAEARYKALQKTFGDKVGIVHGKMKAAEKDKVMQDFNSHNIHILVSTTVIEVGVDIPNATVMVIEHAQRFGLAQLHQLRGRVGRSSYQSFCILLYNQPLTFQGKKRLEVMRDCSDGFEIAAEDLKLRGGGEIIGSKQSGVPKFKFSDLTDEDPECAEILNELFEKSHVYVKEFLKYDPHLSSKKGKALSELLRLFEKKNIKDARKSG